MARDPYIISTVERELRALIASLGPGAQLPGERDLAEQLGASRPTIREVVSRMSRSGQLVRKWGSGTFVPAMRKPFVLELNHSVVLRLDAQNQGFDARFTDIHSETIDTTSIPTIAGPGRRIQRVLRLDDVPVMRLTDDVPSIVNGVEIDYSEFGLVGKEDLIVYIRDCSGLLMVSMDAALRTVVADDVTSRMLDVEEGSPLLMNEFVGRSADGQLVTRSRAEYVQGRVELRFRTSWSPDEVPARAGSAQPQN